MIGIFLRGDDAFILDNPEFEGLSEFSVPTDEAIYRIRNLAYYDGTIQYDGYVALARYAANEPPGTPLTFITNQSPQTIATNLLDMGLGAVQADSLSMQAHGSAEEFDTVHQRIKQRIGQTYIVSVTSNDGLVTNNTLFRSVEAWASGSELNPFSEIAETDICERYKRLLFYDPEEMKSWFKSRFIEEEYIGHRIDKIWEHTNGVYDGVPLAEDPGNLIDLVQAKLTEVSEEDGYYSRPRKSREVVLRMEILRDKFKNWNNGDPSKRTRGGGGGSELKTLSFTPLETNTTGPKIILWNKTKKRNYDTDTDPILTAIAMMFTFCYMHPRLEVLRVLVFSHGYIEGRVKSYNIVPEDTTITMAFPGHLSFFNIYSIFMKKTINETIRIGYTEEDSNPDRHQTLEYKENDLYRNVSMENRVILISLFHNGRHNPHVVLWSMLIVDKMYKLTESRVGNLQPAFRSLGEFVRFVKEGLFWYDRHEIESLSCQVVGAPKTLIGKVLSAYWVNIETTLQSIIHKNTGRLKGIKTEAQFKDLLHDVYMRMPRRMNDFYTFMEGDYATDIPPSDAVVTAHDVLSFAKEWFVRRYLNIDVKKLMKDKPQKPTDNKYEENASYFNTIMEIVMDNVKFDELIFRYMDSNEHKMYADTVVRYENFGTERVSKKDVLEGIYKKFGMNGVADLSMYEVRPRKKVGSTKVGGGSSEKTLMPGGSASTTVAAIAAAIFVVAASTIAGALHS